MRKTMPLLFLMVIITISSCAPQTTAISTPLPATPPAAPEATLTSSAVALTETETPAAIKTYTNSTFGFSFQYPSDWYGPDEYISEQTLRVSVGSDVVYPYGTDRTEQIYNVNNSYYLVLQHSKNDQNTFWKETYESLVNLQDGESISDARSMTIRVRELNLGRFKGIEYISTLSETAQTEPVYLRQVILFDDQSNVVTIMGAPNNVTINSGQAWREAYEKVDEANLGLFRQIVESITIE